MSRHIWLLDFAHLDIGYRLKIVHLPKTGTLGEARESITIFKHSEDLHWTVKKLRLLADALEKENQGA